MKTGAWYMFSYLISRNAETGEEVWSEPVRTYMTSTDIAMMITMHPTGANIISCN